MGWTALMVASESRIAPGLCTTFSRHGSTTGPDASAERPLLAASQHLEIVNELLQAGADVNATNEKGQTSL